MMDRRTLTEVIAEHTPGLMEIPGVVGVGQGWSDPGSEPCISVLVEVDTPEIRNAVPTSIEQFSVEVVETGEISAL